MPVHDWAPVDHGIFHDFHQAWTIEIRNALNAGILPEGYFAMTEQVISGPIPDVITLQQQDLTDIRQASGGLAVADAPPRARFVAVAEPDVYSRRANRIAVKHALGRVVAVIEIVSPGNKSSRHHVRTFVEKAVELLRQEIHLLVVDLFPPSVRDPQGLHKAIWDEIRDEPFELPSDKPLTIAAYFAGVPLTAYVEPVAVGDRLPELPVFLDAGTYVPAPLETTYETTWDKCPAALREIVAG
jgi:hypothetical protein